MLTRPHTGTLTPGSHQVVLNGIIGGQLYMRMEVFYRGADQGDHHLFLLAIFVELTF